MARFPMAALAALTVISVSSTAHAADCPPGQSFAAGGITVTGAFIPAPPRGAPTAGAYLGIANAGSGPDTLTGAESSAAQSVVLHQMSMNGNVAKMAPLAGGLAIPAGGSVTLDMMGYHLMLTGLTQPIAQGDCVAMTLHFAGAGDLPIVLPVGAMGSSAPPAASGVSVMGSGGMDMSSMSMPM